MTPRENILRLYRRQGYAHAPVRLKLCPALQAEYERRAGEAAYGEYFDYPEGFGRRGVPPLQPVPRPPVDWARYYPEPLAPGTRFSDYGVAREPGSVAAAHMTRMHHPLATATSLEEIKAYPYPQYDAQAIDEMRTVTAEIHRDGLAALGQMQCTIWETAWYLRSMPALMMDMYEADEKATVMLDIITENSCRRAVAFAAAGVDIIELGDDVGMQHAPLMSAEMYREWLKPRLAKVIAAVRAVRPDILVFYHSDGFVEPFIPDWLEVGVDILNPVQPESMDFADLHARYGDRISFDGTLGTQTTMPFGTPDDVRTTVHRNLDQAGSAGGLLCCPTHMLEPEVPWANIEAYVQACKDYVPSG